MRMYRNGLWGTSQVHLCGAHLEGASTRTSLVAGMMTVAAMLPALLGLVLLQPVPQQRVVAAPRRTSAVVAALDYKDPEVAKEFSAISALDTEAVEDELAVSGIRVPPTVNDMDMRMMLVEVRRPRARRTQDRRRASLRPRAD